MPELALPTGLKGQEITPKQQEYLRNCYAIVDGVKTIVTRPVSKQAGSSIGKCRGRGMFKDELYMVSNDRLVKITLTDSTKSPYDNLTVTDIGEIAGEGYCQLEAGYTNLCIMSVGGSAYIYNSVDGLREITDVNYKASVSVTYDAGRFVFQPQAGGPFFWTELADPTAIDATSFADAEEFPDLNKAVITKRKTLYVAGTRSFERLQYEPTLNVYRVISGVSGSVGYIGGMVDYSEIFLFIGTGVNGGFSIYSMESSATPISNRAVDDILATYTADELDGVWADSFKWQGVEFALFRLPRHTICFYGDWSIWHNGNASDGLTWSVQFFQFCYGYIFTGDADDVQIGIITESETEYTGPFECSLLTNIRAESNTFQVINNIYAGVNTGKDSAEASIGLSVSVDGVTFGPTSYRKTGPLANYANLISWGRPIAKIRDYLGIKLTWRGPFKLTIDSIGYK